MGVPQGSVLGPQRLSQVTVMMSSASFVPMTLSSMCLPELILYAEIIWEVIEISWDSFCLHHHVSMSNQKYARRSSPIWTAFASLEVACHIKLPWCTLYMQSSHICIRVSCVVLQWNRSSPCIIRHLRF